MLISKTFAKHSESSHQNVQNDSYANWKSKFFRSFRSCRAARERERAREWPNAFIMEILLSIRSVRPQLTCEKKFKIRKEKTKKKCKKLESENQKSNNNSKIEFHLFRIFQDFRNNKLGHAHAQQQRTSLGISIPRHPLSSLWAQRVYRFEWIRLSTAHRFC